MTEPMLHFAIGDIHGELGKLESLHEIIFDRIDAEGLPARIIHLGDYVDRGPDSCGVVERLMSLQKEFADNSGIEVLALMGNHEAMMVSAWLRNTENIHETWFVNGGFQTLDSYANRVVGKPNGWREFVPEEHIAWLRDLPTLIVEPERKLVFVHAGIDPFRYPECGEEIHLWTRSKKFMNDLNWPEREELDGLMVVHGHTPTDDAAPDVSVRRINIDTGACFGGPLTAVLLKDGAEPEFLVAR